MAVSNMIDYFNFINFPQLNVLKTKQELQYLPFCVYYRKHSFLLEPFNEQILQFSSSGLMEFWAKKYLIPHFNIDVQMKPKSLAFNQISGLITVYIWLISASIIAFIFELISTNYSWVRGILDFVHV